MPKLKSKKKTPAPAEGIRRGASGPRGEAIRSDLHVAVEIRPEGGIEIALRSRVETYYGESIRAQVREILETLGVRSARVEIEDQGALPFVIAARIETAVRRAGGAKDRKAPPTWSTTLPASSRRDRLRRSRLYLPGTQPKFFVNASLHDPDAIILDLEDSVHPDEKDAARCIVRNALYAVDFHGAERMVRINQGETGIEDLRAVIPALPDLILIPKVEDPEQVRAADSEIGKILKQEGTERSIRLMPILETAAGIERAFEIATASRRVAALTIGLEDYTADLGTAKTAEGTESFFARARLVNAARAAGIQPIDSVYGDVDDTAGLKRWATGSRRLGFEGMGCVHPRQIDPIHQAFNPTVAEVEQAMRIVAAFREAERKGLGVVSLGSRMIDPPVVDRARQTVERARRIGMIPAEEEAQE